MLAKALGLLDITAVIILLFMKILPSQVVMFFAMLLFAKGFVFTAMGNKVSALDGLAGVYIGLNVYGFNNHVITVFFIIFLAQKGLLSLLAR